LFEIGEGGVQECGGAVVESGAVPIGVVFGAASSGTSVAPSSNVGRAGIGGAVGCSSAGFGVG